MKVANTGSARILWLNIHGYLGLFAGAVLALLGLTGSILVFDKEIDLFFNPQLAIERGSSSMVTYDDVIATIEKRYGHRPHYIEGFARTGRYVAYIRAPSDGKDAIHLISVNPKNGRILDSRLWGGSFVSFVRRLHADLLLGRVGDYIVGGVALASLISIFTGVYLWWPRVGAFRKALSFRRRSSARGLNVETHRLGGFYTAAVLFILALTGTYLALPEPYKAAVGLISQVTPEPEQVVSEPPHQIVKPLSLTAVERVVEEIVPGAVITGIQVPRSAEGAYTVYYRGAAEPFSQFGRSTLWIDQYSGHVLMWRDYNLVSAADRFISSQVLLHNGQFLGWPGRWIVFITGLTITGLYGTGFYLWWTRRRRAWRSEAASPPG